MALFGRTRKLGAGREDGGDAVPSQRQEELEQARRDLMLAALEAVSAEPDDPVAADEETEDSAAVESAEPLPQATEREAAAPDPPGAARMPDRKLHAVMADIVRQDMATRRQQQQQPAADGGPTRPVDS